MLIENESMIKIWILYGFFLSTYINFCNGFELHNDLMTVETINPNKTKMYHKSCYLQSRSYSDYNFIWIFNSSHLNHHLYFFFHQRCFTGFLSSFLADFINFQESLTHLWYSLVSNYGQIPEPG